MAIDLYTGTTGVVLPAAVSNEIWATVSDNSVVMAAARQIPLPGAGVTVPIITGEAVADWVAETDEKPVSRPTLSSKTITGYTVALIVPMSNQFRRDLGALYGALVRELPKAIGKKFDQTVFGYDTAPGANFDTLAAAPVQTLTTDAVYANLLAARGTSAANGGELTSWIFGTQGELKALGEVDGNGRPIFTESAADGAIGRLAGLPVYKSKNVYNADITTTSAPETLGFGWSGGDAVWGQVEAINVSISDQATINDGGTQINLWQRNMFAVRVEACLGFRVKAVNRFIRLGGVNVNTP